MNSKVHAEHIVLLEDDVFSTRIGSRVSSDVVEAESSRKRKASFESIAGLDTWMADQRTHTILNLSSEVVHGHAGLGHSLDMATDLAMYLGGFTVVVQKLVVDVCEYGEVARFFGRSALEIVVLDGIVTDLPLRVRLAGEELRHGNSWRSSLLLPTRGLVLFLVALLSFLLACYDQSLKDS